MSVQSVIRPFNFTEYKANELQTDIDARAELLITDHVRISNNNNIAFILMLTCAISSTAFFVTHPFRNVSIYATRSPRSQCHILVLCSHSS